MQITLGTSSCTSHAQVQTQNVPLSEGNRLDGRRQAGRSPWPCREGGRVRLQGTPVAPVTARATRVACGAGGTEAHRGRWTNHPLCRGARALDPGMKLTLEGLSRALGQQLGGGGLPYLAHLFGIAGCRAGLSTKTHYFGLGFRCWAKSNTNTHLQPPEGLTSTAQGVGW